MKSQFMKTVFISIFLSGSSVLFAQNAGISSDGAMSKTETNANTTDNVTGVPAISPVGFALVQVKVLNQKLESENEALQVQVSSLQEQINTLMHLQAQEDKELASLKQMVFATAQLVGK